MKRRQQIMVRAAGPNQTRFMIGTSSGFTCSRRTFMQIFQWQRKTDHKLWRDALPANDAKGKRHCENPGGKKAL